jgi:hypothetical protein
MARPAKLVADPEQLAHGGGVERSFSGVVNVSGM